MYGTAAWVATCNRGALPLCLQERVVGQSECGKDTMTVFPVEGLRWKEERGMALKMKMPGLTWALGIVTPQQSRGSIENVNKAE